MNTAFWEGMIAGYGIAIPVGAIAILIVDAALRQGLAAGLFAGAGAASADLLFAALAALAGQALAVTLQPASGSLRILSGLALIALGAFGLWNSRRRASAAPATLRGGWRVYGQFLGLTLLNPLTIVYFASLILGGSGGGLASPGEKAFFVLGAGLASLSWQWLLAAFGALARRGLPPGFQRALSLLGNLIVIGLGARILWF